MLLVVFFLMTQWVLFFLFDEKHQILKALALLIDKEQGSINQLLKSEVSELFDNTQLLNEVSSAGNN